MDTIELLRAQAERVNALELASRREYHAYLKSRGDNGDTLEEHIDKYASLARLGPPATEEQLSRLQAICPVPLPAELLGFYRAAGGFEGGVRLQEAVICRPADLLRASERPAGQWDALPSMGWCTSPPPWMGPAAPTIESGRAGMRGGPTSWCRRWRHGWAMASTWIRKTRGLVDLCLATGTSIAASGGSPPDRGISMLPHGRRRTC